MQQSHEPSLHFAPSWRCSRRLPRARRRRRIDCTAKTIVRCRLRVHSSARESRCRLQLGTCSDSQPAEQNAEFAANSTCPAGGVSLHDAELELDAVAPMLELQFAICESQFAKPRPSWPTAPRTTPTGRRRERRRANHLCVRPDLTARTACHMLANRSSTGDQLKSQCQISVRDTQFRVFFPDSVRECMQKPRGFGFVGAKLREIRVLKLSRPKAAFAKVVF